jgi:hypothetical protein
LPYSNKHCEVYLENGGILIDEGGYKDILGNIGFYETSDGVGFRVIQIRTDRASGGGSGIYRFKIETCWNMLRELELPIEQGIYNFNIHLTGDRYKDWLDYFTDIYDFSYVDANTILYDINGKQFILASAVMRIDLWLIRGG